MPRFSYILASITVIALLMFGWTFRTVADPPAAHPESATPGKQFVLPPAKETEKMRSRMRGEALYFYYCATCHGNTGNSDGFNSYGLKKSPPRFSDAEFMANQSDDTIVRTIKEGGRGLGVSPQMPSWSGVLSDQNITDLTRFIRTLAREHD